MRVSRWDAVVENRCNDDENFALPDPVCLRLALSTSGSGEGFLLPKNMIHETIRDADNETELEAHFNGAGNAVLIINTLSEPETGWSMFVFESPEDIDWLVKRLRTLECKWRSAQEQESDNDEEVDQ